MRLYHKFFITVMQILFFAGLSEAQWTSTLLPGADSARGVNALVTDGTDIYAFLLDGPDTMAAAYRYDAGTWSPTSHDVLNGRTNIWSAIAVRPDLLLAGSWSFGIFFSSDRGASWSNYLNPSDQADTLIYGFAYDGTTIYACGYNAVDSAGLIFTSTDGQNWTPMASLPAGGSFAIRTLCWTGSRLFAGTDGGVYYYKGGAWYGLNTLPLSTEYAIYSMAYDSSSNILYAGQFGSGLFSSNNANTADSTTVSWEMLSIPTSYNLLSLSVTPGSILVAGVPGDYVYFSEDHGATWTQSVDGLHNTAANTVLEFKGTTYVGLDSGYVATLSDNSLPVQVTSYKAITSEGGVLLTWTTQSEVNNAGFNILRKDPGSGSFNVIASYTSDDSLKGLGTSTAGRTYNFIDMRVQSGETYQYMIQSVSVSGAKANFGDLKVTVAVPDKYSLYQNYPNPFNPSTKIRFDLKQTSAVTLALYNILGQKVDEWNYGTMNAGSFEKSISLDRYSSGVYFYRITAAGTDGESFVSTKKLVLMK